MAAAPRIQLLVALCLAFFLYPKHCQRESNEEKSQCGPDSAILRVFNELDESNSIRLYDSAPAKVNNNNKTPIAYGSSVIFYCLGNVINKELLKMTWNGKEINYTFFDLMIGLPYKKLELPLGEHNCVCINSENGCQHSITAVVSPGLEVVSPNIQIDYRLDDPAINYTVPYGDSISVICSGPDADQLIISKDGKTLLTKRSSDTTVKHYVQKPDLQTSKYVCRADNTNFNTSVIIKVVPSIYFKSRNNIIKPNFNQLFRKHKYFEELQNYYVQYENSLRMYCSGPRPVKFFGLGNNRTNIEKVNETTIVLIKDLKLRPLDVGCSDDEYPGYFNRISVLVTPRIQVISPNIRYIGKWIDGVTYQYTIKYGDPLKTICFGPNGTKLNLAVHRSTEIKAKCIVNTTSITYVMKDLNIDEELRLVCFVEDCYYIRRFGRRQCTSKSSTDVVVNVLPVNVTDFHCISHDEKRLNCTWTAQTDEVSFSLSEVNVSNEFTRICDLPRLSRKEKFCVWEYEFDYDHKYKKTYNFLLQSCNRWVCSNQTFVINHASVMKIAAPEGLIIVRKTPRGAMLRWKVIHQYRGGIQFDTNSIDCNHKLEYQYSDLHFEVNSSMVKCGKKYCRAELSLPCPGQFFEVDVYHKPKVAAGDEFWSDPSSVRFHTDIENEQDVRREGVCSLSAKKSPDLMKYFNRKLKVHVLLEMLKIRKRVRLLKDKLAIIRKYQSYPKHDRETGS